MTLTIIATNTSTTVTPRHDEMKTHSAIRKRDKFMNGSRKFNLSENSHAAYVMTDAPDFVRHQGHIRAIPGRYRTPSRT